MDFFVEPGLVCQEKGQKAKRKRFSEVNGSLSGLFYWIEVRLGNSILEAQAIAIPEGSPLIESSY